MAVVLEKGAQKKNGISEPIFNTRKLAMIGMFSAIAMILHVLDFPIFFAPGFYKMDFSELPILVGSFAFGPVAGVMMEFVKILLKLCMALLGRNGCISLDQSGSNTTHGLDGQRQRSYIQ